MAPADPLQTVAATTELHTLATSDDQGRVAILATVFCMVCSSLLFLARLWIRWPLSSLFGLDDAMATLGTAFAIIQSIVVVAAVPVGFGRRMSDEDAGTVRIEEMLFASNVLYIVSLCLGRLSMTTLLERLAVGTDLYTKAYRGLTAAVTIWVLISILLLSLTDDISYPWTQLLVKSMYDRNLAISILSSILELFIFCLAIRLVWTLHMTQKSKLKIVSGFATRLPLIATSALRLWSLHSNIHDSPLTLSYTLPEIFTQLDMHYNLISATLPCLRIFLKGFTTGWLGTKGADQARGMRDSIVAVKGVSNLSESKSRGRHGGVEGMMELTLRGAIEEDRRTENGTMTTTTARKSESAVSAVDSEIAIVRKP